MLIDLRITCVVRMTDKGKGKKQKSSKMPYFVSSARDSLRLLRQSFMTRSRDDAEVGCSNPLANTSTPEMDASASPPTTEHDVGDREEEDDEEDEQLDQLVRDQHVYVAHDGKVKITTAVCHLITLSFYLRGDPEGKKWKNNGPETRDFYWREFQKHCSWDRRIPCDMVRNAFMRRAGRLYSRFTYNQRNARVVHKKPPAELIGRWDKFWNSKEFKQESEVKKKNRRKGRNEGVAIGTYTGGSIPFSEHLARLAQKSEAPVTVVDAFKHTKTKKHDGKIWVDPENAQLEADFVQLKQMAEESGLQNRLLISGAFATALFRRKYNDILVSYAGSKAILLMSQESAHGQGKNNEHVSVHTEASSFTPPIQNEPVNQQNVGNNPNAGGQPDLVIPTFLANVLQQIANAPMFQPPPPPPPRVITYKTLRDNGAELFLGDRIGEPQIAWDWIEQTARVLKDLNVPIDNYPRLSSQLLRNEAYEWWKRTDESAGTPKPWTWAHFEWAFKQEYIPKRFSEEKRKKFVELEQGNMALPEYRQKFTKLAKFAPTLVSTPTDRIEEFRTKLRPDLRSRVSVLTTVDFAEAYEIIARADSDLNACIEYLKANNAGPNTYHPTNSASKGKRPFQESSNSHFSKKGKFVQTQSMASVDRSRKRKYPACEHCGRNHPGECWLKQGLCLGCGKPGHFKKECPTNPGEPFPSAPVASQSPSARPAPSQRSTAGSKPAKNKNQQQGRTLARTYAMKARTEENPDVIQGMDISSLPILSNYRTKNLTSSLEWIGSPNTKQLSIADDEQFN
ncbi:unnamed protein product [Cuscuta campestris]|uniref:CCHC-type domain-containing protein n=1 Tax=Cuscuta campestris TaxID=132261 RepID=A0A484MA50_9ASTE|nr:unnamed protein product [Cuscuta campestris]